MPPSATFEEFSSGTKPEELPQHVLEQVGHNWALCGRGIFSWSVFKFYTIRLLTPSGRFDSTQPYILDLSYLRKLSAQQIVTITLQEIERLVCPETEQSASWRQALESIVPDVSLGDRLFGWFKPDEGVYFFSAHRALGSILDAEFARAFAAIWLDPRTQRPALRQALLGAERAAT
ncbi:MAG: chalcone isomerase family protein [Alcaligenaceae bacterium]